MSIEYLSVPARGSGLIAELAARAPDTTNTHKKDSMCMPYVA